MSVKSELKFLANSEKAQILQRFFKTGKGEYGEGDIFLGVQVPEIRKIVKRNLNISLEEIQKCLGSEIHEERLAGLLILVSNYETSPKEIFEFYLKNAKQINNWDLVDLSAPSVVGKYLFDKERKVLYKLAKSENLWERRIAIISTYYFIKRDEFGDALKISDILLEDEQDLIHKAVGWMLREIGKRDLAVEEEFLKKSYKKMPRVMLRYAIEKFDEEKRKKYLMGEI